MISIAFTITGLIYSILLIIIYFPKERIKTFENKVYSLLIASTFCSSVTEIITFILTYNKVGATSQLYIYFTKLLFICFLAWFAFFTLYIISVGRKYRKEDTKVLLNFLPIYGIICLVILFLPIEITETNGLYLPSGIGVNAIFFIALIIIIMMIISVIKSRKYLKNKEYYPLYATILLFALLSVQLKIFPDLFLVNLVFSFITFLMYFTIENPDVKMIEQLNIARDQADKANNAKTEFLSSISHEIRTPLNAIVGLSNSLIENEKLTKKVQTDINDIVSASNNLLEIVNSVLDISKIEANKIEIVKKEYDTKKMFDELIKLTKVRIGEKPIEFTSSIDESIPRVLYGDSVRVKQIILNLLTNAAKYTKEGKIKFVVNSVKKGNVIRLIISVEDTGQGIKEENIEKLFNKFERLEEEDNTSIEGTGLGLAITKKLVELMHGNIVVQSKYGKGSKFTVSIDQGYVDKPTISLDKTDLLIKSMDLKGKKVLVVDDNKLNIKVACKLLEAYNLDIISTLSGEETLELLKKDKSFDLILLDDMMPKMSGTETFNIIKKEKLYDGPIVVLTANALTGEKEKYLEIGFDDYLAKPMEKIELNKVLKKFLEK